MGPLSPEGAMGPWLVESLHSEAAMGSRSRSTGIRATIPDGGRAGHAGGRAVRNPGAGCVRTRRLRASLRLPGALPGSARRVDASTASARRRRGSTGRSVEARSTRNRFAGRLDVVRRHVEVRHRSQDVLAGRERENAFGPKSCDRLVAARPSRPTSTSVSTWSSSTGSPASASPSPSRRAFA